MVDERDDDAGAYERERIDRLHAKQHFTDCRGDALPGGEDGEQQPSAPIAFAWGDVFDAVVIGFGAQNHGERESSHP